MSTTTESEERSDIGETNVAVDEDSAVGDDAYVNPQRAPRQRCSYLIYVAQFRLHRIYHTECSGLSGREWPPLQCLSTKQ